MRSSGRKNVPNHLLHARSIYRWTFFGNDATATWHVRFIQLESAAGFLDHLEAEVSWMCCRRVPKDDDIDDIDYTADIDDIGDIDEQSPKSDMFEGAGPHKHDKTT